MPEPGSPARDIMDQPGTLTPPAMPAVNLRLLLVEDSSDDAELVIATLNGEGFNVQATRVETAEDMQAALRSAHWDAVLSDYNLPTFSTEAALKIVQENALDIPFIIVSAHIGEETAVALMKAGAHDFVMKGKLARLAPALQRELREARLRRERVQAQDKLAANEKFLRTMTAAVGKGIMVQDIHSRLIFMNPEAERLLGWREAELAQRNIHETIHCKHADGSPHKREDCPILHVASSGITYHSDDDVFIHRNGYAFFVNYVATPIIENDKIVSTVIAFNDISARKQMENELIESRKQLRALSTFLQTVREEERKRIARELHDELGQALTALKIDVDWLLAREECSDTRMQEKFRAMHAILGKTVESVRSIAEDLRPGMLDDLGLAAAIEWQVEKFQERNNIPCRLQMNRDEFALDDRVATSVFRIVQEALTNVVRHAAASAVQVQVEQREDGMHLHISDNGKGFQAGPKKRSYGLLGIKERVHILGGSVSIDSQPGAGTSIRAHIPLQGPETEQ